MVLQVEQLRGIQAKGQPALGVRFLRKQHAAHIGVLDNRNLRAGRIFRFGAAALWPLGRVVERVKVAGACESRCAQSDLYACLVHHVEHVGEALMRLADQLADALATLTEVEHRRRGAAVPHLVDQPRQRDVVAFAYAAIGLEVKFRDDEKRNAFDPGGRTLNLRKHQVDDVLGELVITAGNENLVAADSVSTVCEWLGSRTNVCERRVRPAAR